MPEPRPSLRGQSLMRVPGPPAVVLRSAPEVSSGIQKNRHDSVSDSVPGLPVRSRLARTSSTGYDRLDCRLRKITPFSTFTGNDAAQPSSGATAVPVSRCMHQLCSGQVTVRP